MIYKNIADIENELAKHIPLVMQITGKDITLERMEPLMKVLGNPEKKLKIIHVAGTSGKTSTVYYISSLLIEAGQKVGTTVSPHVDSVAERIQINLKPINEPKFCKYFVQFMNIIGKSKIIPTYFEMLVAFALWYFAKIKVDYAVLETGLGGLQDATNVANRSDKVCVITDIGLDHTRILGKTIKEITRQKAGIIHPGNHVITYDQSKEVNNVIKQTVDNKKATVEFIEPKPNQTNLADFKWRNWYLAYKLYQFLADRHKIDTVSRERALKTQNTLVPARMETIKFKNKTIILDGSHNGQKIGALVEAVQQKYPNKSVACLVSFVKTEEQRPKNGLEQLAKLQPHLIVTGFKSTQDTPKESIDPNEVCAAAEKLNLTCQKMPAPKEAFAELMKRPEEILIVTGSFYLLNHVRPLLANTPQ